MGRSCNRGLLDRGLGRAQFPDQFQKAPRSRAGHITATAGEERATLVGSKCVQEETIRGWLNVGGATSFPGKGGDHTDKLSMQSIPGFEAGDTGNAVQASGAKDTLGGMV